MATSGPQPSGGAVVTEVDLEVRCRRCRSPLRAHSPDRATIEVEPCAVCLDEAAMKAMRAVKGAQP